MYWDIGQATRHMTRAGEKSKSSCAHPRGFLLSTCTRRPATTPRATKFSFLSARRGFLALFALSTLLFCAGALAQIPTTPSAPPPPPDQSATAAQDSRLSAEFNL